MSRNGKGAAQAAPTLTDDELDREIHAEIEAAEQGHRSALTHAIRAGELLAEKKGRLGHGEWLPWLEENFPGDCGRRQTYMRLRSKCEARSHLGSVREALAAIREPKQEPKVKPKRPKTTPHTDPIGDLRKRVKELQPNKWGHLPRWTWEDLDLTKAVLAAKKQRSSTGRRLHRVSVYRAQARRDGDSVVLWDTAFEISKLVGLLEGLEVDDIELDEHTADTVNDLHDDMLRLQDWAERVSGAVQGRLGEQAVRQKIAGLRAKTVSRGCSEEEAVAAQRAADRLERRLNNKLVA